MVQTWSSSDGSAAPLMRVPGLARKFWTMISWMWPWRSCRSRMASSASMRSAPRLADADENAGREGHARPAGRLESGKAHGRHLVGRAEVRAAALDSRSDAVSSMMPCDTDTLRRRVSQASSMTPGLRCGSSPVSFSTSAADASR